MSFDVYSGQGSPMLWNKYDAGPSIGLVRRPVFPSRTITGDATIQPYDRLLLVKATPPVNIDITVPTARDWLNSGSGGFPVTVQDAMACFTNGVTITLHASGSDTFNGGNTTIVLSDDYSLATLQAKLDYTGWTVQVATSDAAAINGGPWSPFDYGAIGNGAVDSNGVITGDDDTDAFNALNALIKATFSTEANTYYGETYFGNRRFNVVGSLNFTGISAVGLTINQGNLLSSAAGFPALDFTGGRYSQSYGLSVYGSESTPPLCGYGYGRLSTATTSQAHSLTKCFTDGCFETAGLLNYASEIMTIFSSEFRNNSRNSTAYAAIFQGKNDFAYASEFVTPLTGEESFNFASSEKMTLRRVNAVGATITRVEKTNPAVVHITGTLPQNGDEVTFPSVPGMQNISQRVLTVANRNAGAGTFEVNYDASLEPTEGTSGSVFYRTGNCGYISYAQSQWHKGYYCVTYGGHGWVIKGNDNATYGQAAGLRHIHLEGHTEGSAIQSLWRLEVGSGGLCRIDDAFLSEYNSNATESILSTDATGAQKAIIVGGKIQVLNFQDNLRSTFFSSPENFQFNGKSIIEIGEESELDVDEVVQLLRQPDEIVINDSKWPIRKYNFQHSPGHVQAYDDCKKLTAGLTNNQQVYSPDGKWLDRTGALAGPTMGYSQNASTAGLILVPSAGTDFSDYGTHRRGPQVFGPANGEMIFEFVTFFASLSNFVTAIGFDANPTTAALIDNDMLAYFNAGAITVPHNEACGIVYDAAKGANWYYFRRTGGGAEISTDLGVAASGNAKRFWRITISTSGHVRVFRSTDGISYTLLNTDTTGVDTTLFYAPTISARLTAGVAARTVNLYAMNAICLKTT